MNYRALDKGPRNLWPGLDTANVKASRDARRCGRKKDAMGMKLMKNEGLQTPSWRVSTSAGEQVSHVPTLFAKSARRMGHRQLVWMGRLLAGDMAGGDGVVAGRDDDDRAGHGVPGEWAAGRRDSRDQLAGVYDRGGPGSGRGLD